MKGDVRLSVSSRGWEVTYLRSTGPMLCGWVQAAQDGSWQAIDTSGHLRVANYLNRQPAARALVELVTLPEALQHQLRGRE